MNAQKWPWTCFTLNYPLIIQRKCPADSKLVSKVWIVFSHCNVHVPCDFCDLYGINLFPECESELLLLHRRTEISLVSVCMIQMSQRGTAKLTRVNQVSRAVSIRNLCQKSEYHKNVQTVNVIRHYRHMTFWCRICVSIVVYSLCTSSYRIK